ncbi:hypothetical protein HG535_0A04190 [Zygotorulaspora mrakii]|uniref:Glycosylphosphatidylinositol anchor biosynthesis protein 11 n=1 Tax=Zygotorulaspora mrakii TaxID=42260 RepID=A0A7H9AXG3_ZYGMR|nr:uncharacterized protein HG535_0A04190 [Zygotorulaspora mrakii]QLG70479.1 hypothetical protein HG535_0A04190 [Zygotorulaspora mrakii]
MPVKKRRTVKKTVSFSDDNTFATKSSKKKHIDHDSPPVYVRKTISTIPAHLPALLFYYLYTTESYNTWKLLHLVIPLQVFYLVFQFNKAAVYGNKRLKINVTLVLLSLIAAFLLSLPTMLIIILFGAPSIQKLKETWLLSLHCCYLAYPVVYQVFNCDFKVGLWKRYFILIAVGAWSSCVVIPLDWDRDWQEWPIPIVVGAYLGAFFGYGFGSYI